MGFMNKYVNKFWQLNVAEKIILVNTILFVLPLIVFIFFIYLKFLKQIFIIILNYYQMLPIYYSDLGLC